MRKINLSISGCMGRMGQQLIKSSKKNRNFKLVSLTENRIINKKIFGIKPSKNNSEAFKKSNVIIDFTVPKCTLEILKIASKLKISLRTLYEIAPSKDLLITMTVDNILKKLGKKALERVSSISSPLEKLETYLRIVNQAVGPKFETYIQGLRSVKGSSKLVNYHEKFITNYTQKLLEEALEANEIENIDVKAFAILLGGIGRDFAKEKNRIQINKSPEDSANSITKSILKGIRLEN